MDTSVFSAVTQQSLVDQSASRAKYHLALDLRTLNALAEGYIDKAQPLTQDRPIVTTSS
jgi:hypothetical protein